VCLDHVEDLGNSAEIWSLRVIWSVLLTLSGRAEESLDYLKSKETLYPPRNDDIPSLVGLQNQRGYCLGMLGRFASAHPLLREAERLVRQAGLLELQCEVHQNQAMLFYLQEDYVSSDRVFRLILDEADRIEGWYFRAIALWGIGKNLMIQEHYQAAMPWLGDSLRLF
jgi:tetratricopeptide (TPR) repeat protein